jgi:hypothetical protein
VRRTHYFYDSANRLKKTWYDISGQGEDAPLCPLVAYDYDGLNRKTCVTTYSGSNNGRATVYTYGQLGRVVQLAYPTDNGTRLLGDEYYQYDKAGLMVAKLVGHVTGNTPDSGSKLTEYGYDQLGRQVALKYVTSTTEWPITNDVDQYGDISISSASVTYSYYTGSSLRHEVTRVEGNSTYTDHYEYDALGRLSIYTPAVPAGYSIDSDT